MKLCFLILWLVVGKWVPHTWICTVLGGVTSQLLWELVTLQPGGRDAVWFSSAACCSALCQGGREKPQLTFPSLEFFFLLSFLFSWRQAKKQSIFVQAAFFSLSNSMNSTSPKTHPVGSKVQLAGTEKHVSEVKGAIFCTLVCRNGQ